MHSTELYMHTGVNWLKKDAHKIENKFNFKHLFFSASDEPEKEKQMLSKFHDFQRKAEMYYVYHSIQRYTVSLGPHCFAWSSSIPFAGRTLHVSFAGSSLQHVSLSASQHQWWHPNGRLQSVSFRLNNQIIIEIIQSNPSTANQSHAVLTGQTKQELGRLQVGTLRLWETAVAQISRKISGGHWPRQYHHPIEAIPRWRGECWWRNFKGANIFSLSSRRTCCPCATDAPLQTPC